KHALFILATTEVGKIPQTILSRVQRLDFKLAKSQEISEALRKIIKEEKIDIEEEALKILVRRADGSFRDGVKFLDQVSSEKNKITAESLEENLKQPKFDDLFQLIKNLSERDATESLLAVSKQMETGTDVKELTLSLMDILRSLVFIKNGLGKQLVEPQFTEDKYEEIIVLSASFSSQDLVRILDILQKAMEKLKFASIPSLPLELAVVEICSPVSSVTLIRQPAEKGMTPDIYPSPAKPDQNDKVEPTNFPHPASNDDILKLKEKWTFVLETVRSFNYSLEALLRSVNITECNENAIIMEVPYSFHQRILEAPKNRDLLEGVFSDILARTVKISVSLGNRPEKREDIANIELAADDEIIRAAAEIFNSDTVN
ncbi:MAG: hypothetical protein Q8Q86_01815, partial [Candidatus Daviesbacteria bacterium]|nr:hypothetical protein [Candidatus Daviesbacteria bacterium]